MEKRLLIAVFLSMLLVVLYNLLVPPQPPVPRAPEIGQEKVTGERTPSRPAPSTAPEQTTTEAETSTAIPSLEPERTAPLQTVRVETDLVSVVLSNRGGLIQGIYLKEHVDNAGKPVNLIDPEDVLQFPLYMDLGSLLLNTVVNDSTYEVNLDSLELGTENPKGEVRFTLTTQEGLRVSKTLTFHNSGYGMDVAVAISGLPAESSPPFHRIFWGDQLSGGDVTKSRRFSYDRIITLVGQNRIEQKPEKISFEERYQERLRWTALSSKYFLAALVPRDPSAAAIIQRSRENKAAVGLEFSSKGGEAAHSFLLYAGPKETSALKHYNVSLERVINFGWFNIVALPLLKALVFFYSFTGNYGLAIIILTIIVKALFYPLTGKSFKSMRQMQEIQPKIKLVQERWKNDRQKMNEELMALYREHKVNPLGGCLPILLQMPVFIALYKVLYDAIELRHAPGLLWIQDLSNRDVPLTILMGASMYFQQKLSPSMGDPRQAKMMLYLMPIIFTIMFVNFPSGLVLYWLVNNLLSIVQQYFIMKPSLAQEPAKAEQPKKAPEAHP